jgi:hypothetical protein
MSKDPAGLQWVTHEVWQMKKLYPANARGGICRKVTMTCLRFMFLLCKTFQACGVATTKSDV